jgi:hypothetical protein
MVFNEFDNSSSELLPIFLLIHKEGASNKVLNRRRWWLRCGLISMGASKFGLIQSGSILESTIMGKALPSRHASTYIVIVRSRRTQQRTIEDDI